MPRLVPDLAGDQRRGGARHRRRAAAVGAQPERGLVGVAVHDLDVGGRDADLLGDDLGERRLVALALALHDTRTTALPVGWMRSSEPSAMPRPRMSMSLRGPGADGLGEEGDADAHQLAAFALLGLLAPQLVVAGDAHGLAHGRLVVAGVVDPAGLASCTGTARAG